MALLFTAGPVSAQLPTPPVPGCQYAVKSIHDSKEDYRRATPLQSYDGTKIASPQQLADYARSADGKTTLIEGGDFSAWDFTGVTLSNICFEGSDLSQSNWTGVTATGLGFINADAGGAIMAGAVMTDILIRSSNFASVDATGVDWTSGKLDGGWDGDVEGLKLDDADLTGFRFDCGITVFDGCPLGRSGNSLRGANLAFSDWSSFGFYDADMTGAILNQTIISPRQLTGFKDAMSMGAVFLSGGNEKIMVLPETWAVLMASALEQEREDAPSFDCSAAQTAVEKAICAEDNSLIRKYDRQLATLYKAVRKRDRTVAAAQKAWLARRNSCAATPDIDDCLRQSYDQRVGQLIGLLGEPEWLLSGEEALFLEPVLPLGEEVTASQSYADLIPVLAGASRSSLWMKRSADGSIEAAGEAVGANAHLCSLRVRGLRFDPASGWYGLSGKARTYPVLRYHDGRIEVFQSGRLSAEDELPEMGDNYVSCGARASFPPMVRMAVPAPLMARYRRAAQEER
ncbi:MAG TPA: hypothetical protein VIN76_10855 [Parasphingorhabdus sp.]